MIPAAVVKIDLRTFERAHAITLDPAPDSPENDLRSAVIDPAGNFAYFGTKFQGTVTNQPATQRVVKVQLRRPPNPALVAGADTFALSGGSPRRCRPRGCWPTTATPPTLTRFGPARRPTRPAAR